MCRKQFAATVVEPDGLIENQFRKAARAEPGKAALVIHSPEGEAPIAFETMPTNHCRLSRDAGHGLDWVACDFANRTDVNHRATLYYGVRRVVGALPEAQTKAMTSHHPPKLFDLLCGLILTVLMQDHLGHLTLIVFHESQLRISHRQKEISF